MQLLYKCLLLFTTVTNVWHLKVEHHVLLFLALVCNYVANIMFQLRYSQINMPSVIIS